MIPIECSRGRGIRHAAWLVELAEYFPARSSRIVPRNLNRYGSMHRIPRVRLVDPTRKFLQLRDGLFTTRCGKWCDSNPARAVLRYSRDRVGTAFRENTPCPPLFRVRPERLPTTGFAGPFWR